MPGAEDEDKLALLEQGGEDEIEIDLGEEGGEGGGTATTQQEEGGRMRPSGGDGRVSNQAQEEEEETPEQRRERRRRESKERRDNARRFATQDHAVIAALTEALQKTQTQVKQLGGKLEDLDTEKAVNARDHWSRTARRIRAAYIKAREEGNVEQELELQDRYNQAVANAHHFNGIVQERTQGKGREQQQPSVEEDTSQPPVDIEEQKAITVQKNGEIFMRKYPWYDPQGSDADSRLVLKLDQEVFRDGYKPHTAEYWRELEKRMRAQGLDDDDGGDEQQRDEQPRRPDGTFAPKKTQGGPPVGGRVQGAGKQVVKIPSELKDYMIEAGLWDNQVTRKRVVENYFRNLKKQQAASK